MVAFKAAGNIDQDRCLLGTVPTGSAINLTVLRKIQRRRLG